MARWTFPYGHLSLREREALTLVATGLPDKEIATRMRCRPVTARTFIRRAMEKLAARNRPHAIALWKDLQHDQHQ